MKRLLTLLFCSTTLFAFAQDGSYVQGHVITANGETREGSIWRSNSNWTPVKVSFRDADGLTTQYGPSELRSFYLKPTKQTFIPQTVDIDRKPNNDDNLDLDDKEPRFERVTIFVMVLASGTANLYYHKDLKHHYFIEKGDSTEELLRIRYRITAGSVIKTIDLYKDQLNRFFGDCPGLKSRDVGFDVGSLTSRVEEYNACKGGKASSSVTYDTRADSARFIPTVTIGYSTTALKYSDDDNGSTNRAAAHAKYNMSPSPVFGIGVETNPRRSKAGVSIGLNVYYRKVDFKSNYNDLHYNHDISFKYDYIRTNLLLRFSSREVKPVKFFGTVGPSLGFSVSEKSNLTQRLLHNDAVTYSGIVKEIGTRDFGVVAGAGSMIGPFRIEARLEQLIKREQKLSPPISIGRLYTTTYMLLVSYAFVK